MHPSFQFVSSALAGRMMNSLVIGSAIALLAWSLLRIAGRRNSGTRFAVWFGALVTLAGLPIVGPFFRQSAGPAGSSFSGISLPESWAAYLFFGWAVLSGVALARILIGFLQVLKLRRTCVPVKIEDIDPLLERTLSDVSEGRKAVLCVSDKLQVPTALGFFRPLVALPAWAVKDLSVAELNAILIHELAHVRRWDDWTNLLQKTVRAIFFFHPAAWWIDRQLSLEREMACDDEVLVRTENPRAYARCLVSVAEKSLLRRGIALAQAAVNHVRQTSLRVTQILDGNRSGATGIWKPGLYGMATLSLVTVMLSGQVPELVTFRSSQQPSVRASASATSASPLIAHAAARKTESPNPILAKYVPIVQQADRRMRESKVVAARFHAPSPSESFGGIAVQATQSDPDAGSMLIVVHHQEYGPQGSVFMAVYVWRIDMRPKKST